MIRDNSIGNPFIDSVRNISGARKGVSGFSNITTGRVRNVPSAEYHGHLIGTYMVELNDSGTDQLIPCKVLKASASMDGVGEYIPMEEGDPVTILFKDGRMDVGYILGSTHTEGTYREFLIEGKGKDPFSLTNTGSRDVEINQPSIHPDRVATPDAYFSIVGSRELGKDPYADVALSDPSNLQEVASQRPQPGSILIRNKQGDVAQYAKGDIILYADGDIILLSNKIKEAECNKLRNRVQYYKDLIKKLEAKFKGGNSNSSSTTSTSNESTNTNKNSKIELTDPFTIDANTQKLSTTKIDGLVDLLTSKNITKFPGSDKTEYSITNKSKNTNVEIPEPKLTDDPIENVKKLKEYALTQLTNSQYGSGTRKASDALSKASKELDKITKDSPNYPKVASLKAELDTLSKQVNLSIGSETNTPTEEQVSSNELPPDHPKNREKYSVDALLNADYLEPYILRYHLDQLNKLVGITTSEIETCMRDLAAIQSGNATSTSNNPIDNSGTSGEFNGTYNPTKNKCGKTLVETIKNLSSITGKSYGSGTCYEGVADAIDYAGLGKIGGDCQVNGPNSVAVNLVGYTSWAVDFAKFFTEDPSRLKKFNIRDLKAEGIVDPNDSRVPPGAVIVVGQNEYVARIEGDINIKVDGGEYLNPRSMTGFMRLSDYWNANPDKVHGIYIDATSYSPGDSKETLM